MATIIIIYAYHTAIYIAPGFLKLCDAATPQNDIYIYATTCEISNFRSNSRLALLMVVATSSADFIFQLAPVENFSIFA
jgi:hypothetical protein